MAYLFGSLVYQCYCTLLWPSVYLPKTCQYTTIVVYTLSMHNILGVYTECVSVRYTRFTCTMIYQSLHYRCVIDMYVSRHWYHCGCVRWLCHFYALIQSSNCIARWQSKAKMCIKGHTMWLYSPSTDTTTTSNPFLPWPARPSIQAFQKQSRRSMPISIVSLQTPDTTLNWGGFSRWYLRSFDAVIVMG